MTLLTLIENLLEEKWERSRLGRSTDVPKPHITRNKDVVNDRLSTQDVIRVVDGGDPDAEMIGFGGTHERTSAVAKLEIRSADRREDGIKISGHERVWGKREGLNEPDPDSGLSGEARRVLLDWRCGLAEYDRLWPSPPYDPGVSGKGYYRADIYLTARQHASELPSRQS